MSTTIMTEVFKFDELDDSAKTKAREWWRQASAGDIYWSECAIDDAKKIARMLGFNIEHVYFSGFWSQGDGACIVGTWAAKDVKAAELRAYAPKDRELGSIRKAMRAFARAHRGNTANIKHQGRYYHEHSVSIEADQGEEAFAEIARDYMRWIYRALEREYEYQNADEQVDDNIRANEYTFTADGRRFG